MTRSKGFTLVELMIVIVLLGIVASIAVPNFVHFIQNNQVQAKADEASRLLQYARSQAVSKRTSYQVLLGNNEWTVGPANTNDAERKLEINSVQAAVSHNLPGTPPSLIFNGNGTASEAAAFTVCRDGKAENGFYLAVRPSGLVKRFPRGRKSESEQLSSCTF